MPGDKADEKDLIGEIDARDDWASSLESEEKSIKRED